MQQSAQEQQCKQLLKSNNLYCIRKVGKGGFGFVMLATKVNSSSTYYAVKCINRKKLKQPAMKEYLEQETKTMNRLLHPNIVKLHKTFEEGDWRFLVMEYCDMGNLYQYQAKLQGRVFSLAEAVPIFSQILKGTQFMHAEKIIHRDLKIENVFLKKNKNTNEVICKVGDFGFAKEIAETTDSNCGTTNYMAPEILTNKSYGKEVDVWSLGVVLYYMLFSQYPFKGLNILNDIQAKCDPQFKLNLKSNPFKNKKEEVLIADLFEKIFTINPDARISLKDLRGHPLIKSKDYDIFEDSTMEEDTDETFIEWEIKRIKYIKSLVKDICESQSLKPYLTSSLRFYTNKVIIYFLRNEFILSYKKDHESDKKLVNALSTIESQITKEMVLLLDEIKNDKKALEIENFKEGLNLDKKDFTAFKMAYRNTISKVFEEIHRKITNQTLRAHLKLKAFFLHIINRVFTGKVDPNIFPYFINWLRRNSVRTTSKFYDFTLLQKWISSQTMQNLQNSQELINTKFYK